MKLGIRGSRSRKNWSIRLRPFTSAYSNDHKPTIAPNLWSPWGYSLFSCIMPVATCENRCLFSFVFSGKLNQRRRRLGGEVWLVYLNFCAKKALTHVFLHIDYWLLYIQKCVSGSVASACVGNPPDLGSSPRSSFSPYYFFINIHMQLKPWKRTIHLPNPTSTRPRKSNQWP